MRQHLQRRVAIETVLAILSGVLLVLTLVWSEWIEALFGVDPDHGNGALEWAIAAATTATACVFAVRARIDYRRLTATR